jgi:hypothetical protein
MDAVAQRINRVGVDFVTDRAFDLAIILSELSKTAKLNIAENVINDIASAIALGLFLDNPEDTVSSRMLRVLYALKKMFPRQFDKLASEDPPKISE